jgi:hypothetical protein
MATSATGREVKWARVLMASLTGPLTAPTVIKMDNAAAQALAEDRLKISKRSKHIDIRYHFIRDLVADGTVCLQHVSSSDNLADLLTKSLGAQVFIPLRDLIVTRVPSYFLFFISTVS